jgi:5'-nucleotidase/UDP-sugar diphosphatase
MMPLHSAIMNSTIDISGSNESLYSLTCPLMLGTILSAIPKYTKGKLPIVPKKKDGQPLTSRADALEMPNENAGFLLPPPGKTDENSIATQSVKGALSEIKEWQAIMDYLSGLPVKNKGELPVISVDERAKEVRSIEEGQ